jgi:hypothetical protein
VTVKTGDLIQIQDAIPVRGYLSQGDPRCHFGLGKARKADIVEVRWPDRTTTILNDVAANQVLEVIKPSEAKES